MTPAFSFACCEEFYGYQLCDGHYSACSVCGLCFDTISSLLNKHVQPFFLQLLLCQTFLLEQ